jgi:hypothetical protein
VKLTTYADVVTPGRPTGVGPDNAGELLAEVLSRSAGRYETTIDLPDRVRDHLRRLATLSGDAELAATAERPDLTISLEHLRQQDPDSTRIVYGFRVDREPGDGDLGELDAPRGGPPPA